LNKNAQTVNREIDSEPQEIIQQITKDEGKRGCVEQEQSGNVLQTEKIANSSTTKIDPTSQQEAFNQKYQPVEVLNSEGEWVKGYWVHKCLVVANFEDLERKYALYDEMGAKYVFWGEIRLPRVK